MKEKIEKNEVKISENQTDRAIKYTLFRAAAKHVCRVGGKMSHIFTKVDRGEKLSQREMEIYRALTHWLVAHRLIVRK